MSAQHLPLGARCITPDGYGGIVVAHSTGDASRVMVKRWARWQWLQSCAYDVERLELVDGVTAVESEAA